MNKLLYKWSRNNGVFILILAGFQVIPILYAIIAGESSQLIFSHLIAFFITLATGSLLVGLGGKNPMSAQRPLGFLTAATTLIFIVTLGAVPYVLALDVSILDAIFESASGFSTTGLSLMPSLSDIPRSLMLWRAMSQWIGALFALVYFLRVIYRNEDQYWQGETGLWNRIKLPKHIPNVYKGIVTVTLILLFLTGLQTVILMVSGIPAFYALTHSMSTLSTGGFSFSDGSLLDFAGKQMGLVKYVTLIFMWISGMSYIAHTKYLMGDFRVNTTFLNYIKATIAGALLLFALNPSRLEIGFQEHLFQTVSLLSSSGFGLKADQMATFSNGMIVVALVMAMVGGTIGSPTGGLKINRMTILLRLVRLEVKKLTVPKQTVLSLNYNGKIISQDFMLKTVAIIAMWGFTALTGLVLVSFTTSLDFTQSSIIAIGALGNLGMTTLTSTELATLASSGKVVLILLMLLGRVEITAFILLLNYKGYSKTGGRR